MTDGTGDETRPDRRVSSSETLALRAATRALRLHLDAVPGEYNESATPEGFLTRLAFVSARQRYDCAESLIGAGFGGTVVGSLARSLLVDGLRWLWIAEDPDRTRFLLGDLAEERSRICVQAEVAPTSDTLRGWLMPIRRVADLDAGSRTWFDAPTSPDEGWLLKRLFAGAAPEAAQSSPFGRLLTVGQTLFETAGLQGAAMVLAHAGHGNYLGLQSSLTTDGAPGHDLRADHEALFMHVAAVGVFCTLAGTLQAAPDIWPAHGPGPAEQFLDTGAALTTQVAEAAARIHRLQTRPARKSARTATKPWRGRSANLEDRVTVAALPGRSVDGAQVTQVCTAVEDYWAVTRSHVVNAWDYGNPLLHAMLSYAGGHSNLEAVLATYDQPGSEVIGVFAARMLLEEAARLTWRYSAEGEEAFKQRAKQYFDEYRSRERRTINALTGSGVARADAERIFSLPTNVQLPDQPPQIARHREPIPSVSRMLWDLGRGSRDQGWLRLAYSLLSQVTHATPLGYLHNIAIEGEVLVGNTISPQMLTLALDVACASSSRLIGWSEVLLAHLDPAAVRHRAELQEAATRVHQVARRVHLLG